jgi:hypothetical protein
MLNSMLHTCQSNFPEVAPTTEKQAWTKLKYSRHPELVQRKTGDFMKSSYMNCTVAMPQTSRKSAKYKGNNELNVFHPEVFSKVKRGYYMYRLTQRFISVSRFIDMWATCFDPSLGHPQALKEYRSIISS